MPPGARVIPVTPYDEDGFRITGNGLAVDGIFDSADSGLFNNGTDVFGFCGLCGADNPVIMLAAIDGSAFDLNSFEFGTLFIGDVAGEIMSIVGNFSMGGSISTTVTADPVWATASLVGFTGLSSVTFEGTTDISDLGLDNITINASVPVPAPATIALLSLGLICLRFSKRGIV